MPKRYALLFLLCMLGEIPAAMRGKRGQRGQTPAGQTAGAGDRAQGLLQTVCIACHNLNRVQTKNLAQSNWQIIVDRMKGKGAELSDEDFSGLIEYLAKT